MTRLARNLFLALAAGAAGGAAASLLQRKDGGVHPTAKRAVKSGMLLYDRLRGVVGEATETMSDIVAEVQAEIEAERTAESAGADDHVVPFEMKATESEKKAHG
jgi:hypothetical protein